MDRLVDGAVDARPAQLALALEVLAIVNGRWAWAGAAFGAAGVVRPPLLVVVGVLLFLAMVRGRSWRIMTLGLGPLVAVGLLLTYNGLVFGRIGLDSGYQESGARDVASGPLHFLGNLPGAFFSPARGLFVLSPFLLLLCWGVAPAWRHAQPVVQDCAVAGTVYLLSQLWLLPFSGADGFYGYRLPLESLILVAPLLALAYEELVTTTARRLLFAAAAAISVAFEAVAAFLRHPPLVVPDAWRSFMPATAVGREPLGAFVAAALAVSAVVAWAWTAGRPRPASSVRSESPRGV
jgi:alpha-1,2-mannosyltransferase